MLVTMFLRFAGLGPFVNLAVKDGLSLTLRTLPIMQTRNSIASFKITDDRVSTKAISVEKLFITNDKEFATFRVDLVDSIELLELEIATPSSSVYRQVLIPMKAFSDPSLGPTPARHVLATVDGQAGIKVDILSSFPPPPEVLSKLIAFKSISFDYFKAANNLVFGHRGMGITFKYYLKKGPDGKPIMNPWIENTIPSFNAVAAAGGDGIEFDVVLTKDLVPIIYHDFYIVVRARALSDETNHFVKVPIHDLTYADIRSMQMYHAGVLTAVATRPDLDPEMFRIPTDIGFPTLAEMLQKTDARLAFNLEIKYPQLNSTGEHECLGYHDRNTVADNILAVLVDFAGEHRAIVMSTFDFDMSDVISSKQSVWPVAALTQGDKSPWPPMADPRTVTTKTSAQYASGSKIWGISAHAEELLDNKSLLGYVRQTAGVSLMIWGEMLADPSTAASLMPQNTEATANIIITDNTPGVVEACKGKK